MKPKYNYVIYHKNCIDGFTSFFILYKSGLIDKKAIIYPDVPSAKTTPPNIDGKNVISMDVAYKKDVLKEMFSRVKSMVFLDHHITIHNDVIELKKTLGKTDHIEIVYDEHKSGASLTWHYLYPNRKPPLLVRYVEDNDIGLWKMKYTYEFIAGLDTLYSLNPSKSNLIYWDKLLKSEQIKKVISRGKIYFQYINKLVDDQSKRYSIEAFPSEKIYDKFSDYFQKPYQYKVAVYSGSGCPTATLLALKMLDKIKCDFVIMWVYHMDRKEYVLTFRSKTVDVGNIAKMFGGGGHKLASACSFSSKDYHIEDLFAKESLPRS